MKPSQKKFGSATRLYLNYFNRLTAFTMVFDKNLITAGFLSRAEINGIVRDIQTIAASAGFYKKIGYECPPFVFGITRGDVDGRQWAMIIAGYSFNYTQSQSKAGESRWPIEISMT